MLPLSVVLTSAHACAVMLFFPALNAMIAQQVDEVAVADRGDQIVDDVLAKDSQILAGSLATRWLNFDLLLDDTTLPMTAARRLFDASITVKPMDNATPQVKDDVVDSSGAITFDAAAIDNTWLHVTETRPPRETFPILSRINFSPGEQSVQLFGPRYEGAPKLTLPSVYSWQLAPRISLNQDFHFMYDPLGPERDFEDTWATGFRVQIKF